VIEDDWARLPLAGRPGTAARSCTTTSDGHVVHLSSLSKARAEPADRRAGRLAARPPHGWLPFRVVDDFGVARPLQETG
jgi:hypothetical protein